MKNIKFKLIASLIVLIFALSPLAADGRGKWFSLGFGASADVVNVSLDGNWGVKWPNGVIINAEFAMYPQATVGNFLVHLSFTLSSVDATVLFRRQWASGFAIGLGAGACHHFSGEAKRTELEIAVEPSYAFNLKARNSSFGVVRIYLLPGFRYDFSAEKWNLNANLGLIVYLI